MISMLITIPSPLVLVAGLLIIGLLWWILFRRK